MPRNGAGIFSLPAGSTITNGDVSDASDLNTPLADIASDLNIARPVVAGGTGATSASAARTNLGLEIGANVQAYDATLTSLAALGTAADKLAYTTGVDTWAEAPISAFALTLLDDTTATVARTTLDAMRLSAGSGADLDARAMTDNGVFSFADTSTGAPSGLGVFDASGFQFGYAQHAIQLGSIDPNASALMLRVNDGGGWQTWKTVTHDGNFSTPLTANLPAAQAAQALGSIGTYAFLRKKVANSSIVAGSTYAAADLAYSGVGLDSDGGANISFPGDSNTSPSGTWRAFGSSSAQTVRYSATLFMRIA